MSQSPSCRTLTKDDRGKLRKASSILDLQTQQKKKKSEGQVEKHNEEDMNVMLFRNHKMAKAILLYSLGGIHC